MKYFISGHRIVDQEFFNTYYKPFLERVLENDDEAEFVVGDCEGIDTMAQEWLKENVKGEKVTIYHMFTSPRVIRSISFNTIGGFKSDVERDSAMTEASDVDIAYILPGKWTSGTAQNILRRYEVHN